MDLQMQPQVSSQAREGKRGLGRQPLWHLGTRYRAFPGANAENRSARSIQSFIPWHLVRGQLWKVLDDLDLYL